MTIGDKVVSVLGEVAVERTRQDARWGEQNHPDGTGRTGSRDRADQARKLTETAARNGLMCWRFILAEEFFEAMAELEPQRLRAELIQVAAVAAAWAEAIDRRTA